MQLAGLSFRNWYHFYAILRHNHLSTRQRRHPQTQSSQKIQEVVAETEPEPGRVGVGCRCRRCHLKTACFHRGRVERQFHFHKKINQNQLRRYFSVSNQWQPRASSSWNKYARTYQKLVVVTMTKTHTCRRRSSSTWVSENQLQQMRRLE